MLSIITSKSQRDLLKFKQSQHMGDAQYTMKTFLQNEITCAKVPQDANVWEQRYLFLLVEGKKMTKLVRFQQHDLSPYQLQQVLVVYVSRSSPSCFYLLRKSTNLQFEMSLLEFDSTLEEYFRLAGEDAPPRQQRALPALPASTRANQMASDIKLGIFCSLICANYI